MGRRSWFSILVLSLMGHLALTGCNGKAEDFFSGNLIGDAVIGDGDGERNDGTTGAQIYPVTTIVESTSDIPEWTNSDMPFTGTRQGFNATAQNNYWPFKFTYTYPVNNYSIGEAHLIFATSRDNSDTEGIFIDGVLTGRPPGGNVAATTTKVTYKNYECVGACSGAAIPPGGSTPNRYFMDWALTHYKINEPNTFDLNITNLLTSTPLTVKNILEDGVVRIVTGDDAAVYGDNAGSSLSRPLLVMAGFTISSSPLTCTTSPVYYFKNRYIHNDGNSVSQAAFKETVLNPNVSWTTAYTTFRSTEFYYDPKLPQLASYNNLNVTTANLILNMKRHNADPTAMVINGIGFDQTGFDRTQATAQVETWATNPTALAYYHSLIDAVPTGNTSTPVTIDLVSLLGATKVKELLLQGKLNIAFAGPVAQVYGQNPTSNRTYGVIVNGPELVLQGNFTTEICEIPFDVNSPLNGASGQPGSCTVDATAPVVSSMQVSSITSTGATIQWLTNEPATSQVGHGLTSPTTVSAENTTPKSFHSVTITGLQPYKYYQYNVRSKDGCGNSVTSTTKSFRTLR